MPPWFNLLPKQKSNFDTYPDLKVWIWDWQASKEADLMQASDNLIREFIFCMTGERVNTAGERGTLKKLQGLLQTAIPFFGIWYDKGSGRHY